MGGASIDLREVTGSTEDDSTGSCTTQRWNSQTSECEYSRPDAARNAYCRVRYGRSFDWRSNFRSIASCISPIRTFRLAAPMRSRRMYGNCGECHDEKENLSGPSG